MTTTTDLDLFDGLSADEVASVLPLASPVFIPAGTDLFALGAVAEHLYVVQRGRVRLTLPIRVRGREEEIVVDERQAGQTVGWSALVPPFRFTLAASAPLDTEVLAFRRDALIAHFEANPRTGYRVCLNLASGVGQRLQLFQAMWMREMQRTVEQRCA